ncbi:MAG: transketolase [Deltaproteobacteria bacterium]|nr:MAG: transketolase [Deltaproteobacteria bacterium]
MDAPDLDLLAVNTIRGLAMDAVQKANSGHPGTPMALAPLGWVLFKELRRHDPTDPEWPDRDRFVLSCGHASMLQYALLYLCGYDLTLEDIEQFRQWGSKTPGHPEAGHTPGVETTTGPLGQGFANAVGMAMAERHLARRFNRPGHTVVDHHTWVIASDGDLMEGVCQEAASLAGHLRLRKLVVFWDDNRITIDGRTDLTFTEDVLRRFEAYEWDVFSVEDGNDLDALRRVAAQAKASDRPALVRVRTHIGYPSPGKQDTPAAHGAPLGEEEVRRTKEVMGWPQQPFYVPPEMAALRQRIVARGQEAHAAWQAAMDAYRKAHPDLHAELERVLAGRLPGAWDEALPHFEPDPKGIATRKASGKVLNAIAARVPELVGGSADLAGSNNVHLEGKAAFTPEEDGAVPQNVHWGIREHAMAAAVNGMALHGGVVPFGATFLVFADYLRPALRLACLMDLPVRYVFTHDSIGLGEDGPTHQPVEHLASLRAMPGMTVLRPADANEVRECWRIAMERKGPVALVLTRQKVPILDRSGLAPASEARRGAYLLAPADGEAKVRLVATGSEVHVALAAQRLLAEQGIGAAVVSMPSWELFAEQSQAYRDSVLPPEVPAVVVEAAVSFGWARWVGRRAAFVTLERYGASAPGPVLFEKLGLTPERVAEAAQSLISP